MAYDVKCPSCGARNVLEESQLGLSVACIKCHKDWMFDGPIRQRKAAHAADDLKRRREAAIKKARRTAAMKANLGKQPQYAILEVASWCCYVLSGLSALALIIMLFDGDKAAPLLGLQLGLPDRFIFAWLIVSIVYVATSGAVIAAFRDIAINSWKSVNKE